MMVFHILFVQHYLYNPPSWDLGKPRLSNDGAICYVYIHKIDVFGF